MVPEVKKNCEQIREWINEEPSRGHIPVTRIIGEHGKVAFMESVGLFADQVAITHGNEETNRMLDRYFETLNRYLLKEETAAINANDFLFLAELLAKIDELFKIMAATKDLRTMKREWTIKCTHQEEKFLANLAAAVVTGNKTVCDRVEIQPADTLLKDCPTTNLKANLSPECLEFLYNKQVNKLSYEVYWKDEELYFLEIHVRDGHMQYEEYQQREAWFQEFAREALENNPELKQRILERNYD